MNRAARTAAHRDIRELRPCRGSAAAGQPEARGLTGSVQWTKAASLLAAAKVQQQFEEYQNCVIKVREARGYLREIADG